MTKNRSDQDQLNIVRSRYAAIATGKASSCCGDTAAVEGSCGNSSPFAPAELDLREVARQLGYTEQQLAALPENENLTLGCGNPLTAVLIEPGMTVLDLGSGAGFDCFIAAQQVGPEGRVIGVDMTPEMLARARANAADKPHVEFRLGELEHLPVADNTVDVIMSNCVVNLVPDKAQVFREAHRVLKPGGRLAISDVIRHADFPPEVLERDTSLSACISGAATVTEIEGYLREAGFDDVRVVVNERSGEFIQDWDPGSSAEKYVRAALIEARK